MSYFKAKKTKFPRWGAYSAPPDPVADFQRYISKGREGKGREGKDSLVHVIPPDVKSWIKPWLRT